MMHDTKAKLVAAILLTLLGLGLFTPVVVRLAEFSQMQGSKHYSHFVLIPLIAGYGIFVRRRDIWEAALEQGKKQPRVPLSWHVLPGLLGPVLVAFSLVIYAFEARWNFGISLNDHLVLMTASLVVYIMGAFVWVFGSDAFRVARFPLLFLVFLIPVPEVLLQRIIVGLQVASTGVVDFLFQLTGTVYLRDGFRFSLPGLQIEIAQQCSGIRSGLSLFIVSILAGHMSLRTTWGKLALALAVFPITVFKNGVRIVLLSLLAVHWDPAIMHGSLHTTGGIPFFVVAMALLGLALLAIRRLEGRAHSRSKRSVESALP